VAKQTSEHWHCANPGCGWSAVLVTLDEAEAAAAPICVCGSPLQKSQLQPVFSYLDFLRGEDSLETDDRRDMD
jgi:hypothetical protein